MSEIPQPRTALVTGATSNIGRAIATELARQGDHVVLSGRDGARGERIVDAIRAEGGRADFVRADLGASWAAAEQLAAQATERLGGPVRVLVNNAGVFPAAATLETDERTFDTIFDLNVKGLFALTRALAPGMIAQQDGAIISISSWLARLGHPATVAYNSSKGAVEALTRSWATEFGPHGIRVNAIAPGLIRDPDAGEGAGPETELVMAGTPAGESGRPEAIAHAVAYLASDAARFVHGTVLDVDGGRGSATVVAA